VIKFDIIKRGQNEDEIRIRHQCSADIAIYIVVQKKSLSGKYLFD